MDLVKNRMQVSGEGGGARLYNNSLHCAQTIIKTEGITGLYSGLTASFARQLSYTTVRLGVYQTLLERFSTDGETPGFALKTALGMTAGSIGAFFGTPADVALVRMTVDKRLPVAERRNYSSVLDAWAKIVRDEGITALWVSFLFGIRAHKASERSSTDDLQSNDCQCLPVVGSDASQRSNLCEI